MRPIWVYSAGFLLLAVLTYASTTATFLVYDMLPDEVLRSTWAVYVLNWVAPFVAGLICGGLLAAWLIRKRIFASSLLGHLSRAAPWYAYTLWVLYIIKQNDGNSDFGLVSQAITWPLWGVYGALFADIVLSVMWSRRIRADATPSQQ